MKVLGISGTGRETGVAAALAVDGRIVAAVRGDAVRPDDGEDGSATSLDRAIDACLAAAACDRSSLDALLWARDEAGQEAVELGEWLGVRASFVDPLDADAGQAWMTHPDARAALVVGDRPARFGAYSLNGRLEARGAVIDVSPLVHAAETLARALGLDTNRPYLALDRASLGGDGDAIPPMAAVLAWSSDGVRVNAEALSRLVRDASEGVGGDLADRSSRNVRLLAARRDLAAAFLDRLADVVADAAAALTGEHPDGIVLGGSLLESARINSALAARLGPSLRVAAVPGRSGRALGAALAGVVPRSEDGQFGLALGPAFDDDAIKATLDNCRLDYVYEADWSRLAARVSKLLAQGKVVGWFQGPLAFGDDPAGTRSVLADPSNRYARHNVNEYLRRMPLDEPLPVSLAPSLRGAVLADSATGYVADVEVVPEYRPKLVSALDGRQRVRVHASAGTTSAELAHLLEVHAGRTGTPGLVETMLADPGRPLACSPRDALRIVYSSAIDALVMGRFLLMKDHWLLRSEGA